MRKTISFGFVMVNGKIEKMKCPMTEAEKEELKRLKPELVKKYIDPTSRRIGHLEGLRDALRRGGEHE